MSQGAHPLRRSITVISILIFMVWGCEPPAPEFCGDGVVQSGEDCDDGNRADGDECGSACRNLVII